MFPEDYLEEFLIPETNKGLSVPTDLQEYIKWVGCWLYTACWVGIESRWDWWSTTTPSMAKCAPFRLNSIMYCNRFDYILSDLSFTNREVPYKDGFLQMRQLEEAWNQNMAQQFLPAWINFIDESMMEWFNKWSPGFICVGRNRITLAMSGIQFVALSPPFCGEYRSWRASTDQLNLVKKNGKSWGRLLSSCYECVS